VEGWVRSGSFVDVILLKQEQSSRSGISAKIIAENVRILSAGRSTEPLNGQTSAPRAPATVTMLVSQANALKIKTAASVGKLTFSLRGIGDTEPAIARTVNQGELLDSAKNIIPKKQAYKGRATGPDGKTYVLGADSQWVRTLEERTSYYSAGEVP
jgi:Flp pilus assembly protein CpaB